MFPISSFDTYTHNFCILLSTMQYKKLWLILSLKINSKLDCIWQKWSDLFVLLISFILLVILFIAIAGAMRLLGPVCGYSLASATLSLWKHPFRSLPLNIHPSHPSWIGAWWIGNFVYFIAWNFFLFVTFCRCSICISVIFKYYKQ